MCIFLYIQLLMFVFVIMCSKAKQRTKNIVFLVTTLLWGVVFGLRRSDVGNDSNMYRMFYTGYSIPGLGTYEINSETEEYGFTLVANILHRISPDVTFFYMAVSLAVFLNIRRFCLKNRIRRCLRKNRNFLVPVRQKVISLPICPMKSVHQSMPCLVWMK